MRAVSRSSKTQPHRLLTLAEQKRLQFLDLSRAFHGETSTTFADLWHFADPGHRILAQNMVVQIATILATK